MFIYYIDAFRPFAAIFIVQVMINNLKQTSQIIRSITFTKRLPDLALGYNNTVLLVSRFFCDVYIW